MTAQALLLASRKKLDPTCDDGQLQMRLNQDYIQAFAPQIAELQRLGYTTAYIIPKVWLRPDEQALLYTRGAQDVDAQIVYFKQFQYREHLRALSGRILSGRICVFTQFYQGGLVCGAYHVPNATEPPPI